MDRKYLGENVSMSKRFRELAREAGGHFSTHNLMSNPVQHRESIELWDKNIEKFAELIVVECAEYAEHNLDMAGYKKKFMLKHFGVEE